MKNIKILDRSEISEQYKWDIDLLYPNHDTLIQDVESVRNYIENIEFLKGTLGTSADNLNKCLKLVEEAGIICERIQTYTSMKRDEDNSKTYGQEIADLGEKISVEFDAATSFIHPEIIDIGYEKINSFMNEEPELKLYNHYFNNILRRKNHYLSIDEENLIAQSSEITSGYENSFKMLSYVDLKLPKVEDTNGEQHELTASNFSLYLQSEDRSLRKNAFNSFYEKYLEFKNTYGALLAGSIKKDVFYSRVKKYDSSLNAALFNDNIDESVYSTLISSVSSNIKYLDRYCSIKKNLLKLDELHLYDLYAPVVKEVQMNIDYKDAKEMVLEGLAILGKDYNSIVNEAYNNRWIDVYENKGKYSGAYSWGSYDTKPYILLNYNGTLNNVLTLAHEMGHSVHSYLSRKHQPYIYSNYTIFCAEVASITNECLMYMYFINKLEGEPRKYIINEFLELIRTTFYRQTMFAEFELITHKIVEDGEALTGDRMSIEWKKLYDKYYGRECVIDSGIEMEWARIPHFYNAFYVYKYATGLSAAISLAKGIIEDKNNISKYLNFLKSGGSKYSLDLLKEAGVDMTSPKPLNNTADMFKYLLDELEK